MSHKLKDGTIKDREKGEVEVVEKKADLPAAAIRQAKKDLERDTIKSAVLTDDNHVRVTIIDTGVNCMAEASFLYNIEDIEV